MGDYGTDTHTGWRYWQEGPIGKDTEGLDGDGIWGGGMGVGCWERLLMADLIGVLTTGAQVVVSLQ